ncbi:hypothetical protein H920_07049 [Fukomys damarensis]|uniref:Uncharacterized protein n=1 Tax=Fukomys damarensis TaxID=885580 RepID=A0A091DMM9_FUKDA|nr:hypothetical protein H920_07049 [Fukomys damarensis]
MCGNLKGPPSTFQISSSGQNQQHTELLGANLVRPAPKPDRFVSLQCSKPPPTDLQRLLPRLAPQSSPGGRQPCAPSQGGFPRGLSVIHGPEGPSSYPGSTLHFMLLVRLLTPPLVLEETPFSSLPAGVRSDSAEPEALGLRPAHWSARLPGLLELRKRETMQLRQALGCFKGADIRRAFSWLDIFVRCSVHRGQHQHERECPVGEKVVEEGAKMSGCPQVWFPWASSGDKANSQGKALLEKWTLGVVGGSTVKLNLPGFGKDSPGAKATPEGQVRVPLLELPRQPRL